MENHKVLVIDDSYVNRNLVKKIIKEANHILLGEAQDGQEAIEKIGELQPTVITLDLNMPNVNGYDVIEYVKKHHPLLPIIVITGDRFIENHDRALELGADFVIKKPFQPAFLMKRFDLTPVLDNIYEPIKEEPIEEDIEFELVNSQIERPDPNIKIFNAHSQIVFEEESLNNKEKHVLRKEAVIETADIEEDDELLFSSKQSKPVSKHKVIVLPEGTDEQEPIEASQIVENKPVIKDEIPSFRPMPNIVKNDEEVLNETKANAISFIDESDVKEFEINSNSDAKPVEPQHSDSNKELESDVSKEKFPIVPSKEEQDNYNPLYDKELFVVYDYVEPSESKKEDTPVAAPVQKKKTLDERLTRPIRPPMTNRRPLTQTEKDRHSAFTGENEGDSIKSTPKEKSGGFFSKLFKKKK